MHPRTIYITFFLSLLVCTLHTNAANPPAHPYNANNNTNNPSFQNNVGSPHININNQPEYHNAVTAMIDRVSIRVEQITVLVLQTFKEIVNKKNAELLRDLIKQIIWENRYKIAGGTAIGSYGAANLLLIADYYHLNNTMIWTQWKHQSTFEDLCAVSQKELAKELLLAIGEHHYNKDNPTDLAYPLVTFIKQIDWEIDTIKRYIKTVKIIKSIALMPFFATNDKKLDRANRSLQRILFIKHIFLSWLADYNLTSTEKLNA